MCRSPAAEGGGQHPSSTRPRGRARVPGRAGREGLLLRQDVQLGGRRQEAAVPHGGGVHARLGVVGVRNLRSHQREPLGLHLAEALGARIRAVDHRVDGQLQPARLERGVHDAVALLHVGDGGAGVGDHLLRAAGEGLQESLHRLGVLLEDLRARDDGVAVELHAVVGIGQHDHVRRLGAARLQVQQGGEGEPGDRVHVAAHEHGLAQGRIHGGPLHAGDLVGLGEDREGAAPGVEHRRAQLPAVQVGGLGDAALLQRHDRCGRVVVDHHHGHGLVLRVRVVAVEFHHRGQVGEADVVRARGHALHRAARAVAGIHRDVQAGLLEVALGRRQQEEGRGPLEAPVELELDGGGRAGLGLRGGRQQARCGEQQGGLQEGTLGHGVSIRVDRYREYQQDRCLSAAGCRAQYAWIAPAWCSFHVCRWLSGVPRSRGAWRRAHRAVRGWGRPPPPGAGRARTPRGRAGAAWGSRGGRP